MNRRDFLKGLGFSTLALLAPHLALANGLSHSTNRRILVLVELKGANDGINTLVPYTNPAYYNARPQVVLERSRILPLSGTVGLHPALSPLMPAWQQGEMAWIQGVGYDDPNRSHFESIEIWDTATSNIRVLRDGWIAQCFPHHDLAGIAIDTNLGPLYGATCSALGISDPVQFVNMGRDIHAMRSSSTNTALQHVLDVQAHVDILSSSLAGYLSNVPAAVEQFAMTAFGRSLNSVYTLIAAGLNVPAYKVTLEGFDTHVSQLPIHERLLGTLATGLATLRKNLANLGMWDEVLVMTYSEFGRRLQENASKGTDHGAAAPHLVMGGKVKGGLYGEYPSLTDLDERGDLLYSTDFRDMYATIQKAWWGLEAQGKPLAFV